MWKIFPKSAQNSINIINFVILLVIGTLISFLTAVGEELGWRGYMSETPIVYRLFAFTLCIFSVGIVVSILTIKSNSIWTAALLHAAHNNIDQAIFSPLTKYENSLFFVSETGILRY